MMDNDGSIGICASGICGMTTGGTCTVSSQCQSGICNTITNVCVSTTCSDGIVSGLETDIDCGKCTMICTDKKYDMMI